MPGAGALALGRSRRKDCRALRAGVSGRVWDAWTGWGSEAGAVWSRWAAGGAGVPEGVIGGCDSAVGAGGKRCEGVMG